MTCSTCDGYEFVPNPTAPDGPLVDCPDCRAVDERPLVWCPTHSTRVELDGSCRKCRVEAVNAEEQIVARSLRTRATVAARTAKTPTEQQVARDLIARARLAAEAAA